MPKTNNPKRGQELSLEEVLQSAIGQGIFSITKKNPRLQGQEQFISQYINQKTLQKYTQRFARDLEKVPENKKEDYVKQFHDTLANYVASGELLNEKGKEYALRTSLKKRAKGFLPKRGKRDAREILEGEEYLNKTIESFRDLAALMQSGGYERSKPELANAVKSVADAGFWDAAINVLYENKQMNHDKYITLKKALRGKVDEGVHLTKRHLEEYLQPQTAAAFFTGLGIIIVLGLTLSNHITGNIIGITKSPFIPALIFAGASIATGIFLFFKKKK